MKQFAEIRKVKNEVEQCFDKIKSALPKVKLSDGNCGQVAFAIAKKVKGATIGLITDAQTEEELFTGEPTLFHVFVEYKGKMYDETGEISTSYLEDFVSREYGPQNQDSVIYGDYPADEKTRRMISIETEWDTEWTVFYKVL